ncbi:TPA: hypothetical protein CPT87_04980 [Candidatus Gastranaerophilales bacterium HUM_5]|nr:MAG TPA: hypothetical protein CPT99_02020 [Candidatus Gastranaerophilales bacterium HUM_4]DAA90572.1 MAG TPA: hypothetical protein CPT87_04980 [Candidatus Gastranaerophilales bacterium HUM_5]
MNIMPISTNNSTTFGQTQVKKSVPKKILTYAAAGLTGLGITACGPNYEGLKNCDVFEHIDKKELFEAFSTEYLSNVQKISDTEYTADIGYRTTGNFDAGGKGDIQGSIYIKKDKNDPNHVIGRVKLVEVNSYLEFYDEPNCFGGTTSRANRITYKAPYKDLHFDAKLIKDKNSDNYKVQLKVTDENNEYSEHTLEKNKRGIFLDGETPFKEVHRAENLTMFVAISTAAVFTLLGLGLCPSKDK